MPPSPRWDTSIRRRPSPSSSRHRGCRSRGCASRRSARCRAAARRACHEILQWLAAVDRAPEVVSAAVDALARVGMRDDEQGSAAARCADRADRGAVAAGVGHHHAERLASEPDRRRRQRPASCINGRQVRERRGAGAHEAARCVSSVGTGAGRRGQLRAVDGDRRAEAPGNAELAAEADGAGENRSRW